MKGIILSGGKGTRLYPLTRTCNKHMLKVGKEPMLFNPIRQMLSAGIREILIVSSTWDIDNIGEAVKHAGFKGDFYFAVQKEPRGIADALLFAEDFAGKDMMTVILGDNISTHSILPYIKRFEVQGRGAKVLLCRVKDPWRYGVAVLKDGGLDRIVEKPEMYIGDLAVTGIYFYDNRVFEIIRSTSPSERGELEITAVNNIYLKKQELTYDIIKGGWIDAGTIEAYKRANSLLSELGNKIISG